MLILSRRCGERIQIGPNIEIEVVQLHKGHVRLAITAPREIRILRGPEHGAAGPIQEESRSSQSSDATQAAPVEQGGTALSVFMRERMGTDDTPPARPEQWVWANDRNQTGRASRGDHSLAEHGSA